LVSLHGRYECPYISEADLFLIVKSLKYASVSVVSISILFTIALAFSAINVAHAIGVNATINGGPTPMGIVYNSGKNLIITANYKLDPTNPNSANKISLINDTTNRLIGSIAIPFIQTTGSRGAFPVDLAYAPDQNLTFVSCGAGTVAVVADKDSHIVANVEVGGNPSGIAYDSDKKEVYVVNTNDGTVSVIDINYKVIATIPVGKGPTRVAYNSGKGEVFVANEESSTVSVISDSKHEVVATITVDAGATGFGPTGVAYDSGQHKVYVANPHYNTVSIIPDAVYQVKSTIKNISGARSVAYDSGKGQIWVLTSGGVSVISDSNDQVIASVGLASGLYGITYDSGKGEIFVTSTQDGAVYMISDSFSTPKPTQTTGSLVISVKDSSGGVLSGVAVSSTIQPSGQSGVSGTTSSDGSVTFSNVAVGAYTLQASKSGYVTGAGSGSVVAGSSASVSIVLQTQSSGGGGGGVPGFPIEANVLGIILIVAVMIIRRRSSS
jgi:YVTN family beta-propeller protein